MKEPYTQEIQGETFVVAERLLPNGGGQAVSFRVTPDRPLDVLLKMAKKWQEEGFK